MAVNTLKLLDPVQGLVDYVLDVKPYHTKIVEVLIEYVYNEFVDVTIIDELSTKILLFFPNDKHNVLPVLCDGGYSTRPYGDYGRHPIISPNQSVTFESYPAINGTNNSFVVPGDKTQEFKVGYTLCLISVIEDYSNIHNIIAVNAGVASITNPPTFTVSGDQTSQFTNGYVFDVVGSLDNNRTYVTNAPSTYNGVSNTTTIFVGQSIVGSVAYGQVGVTKVNVPANSGVFTVSSTTYDAGNVGSWVDVTDPSTFRLGVDPHTIVFVDESLDSIPALSPSEVYSSFVTTKPIVITGLLSYSNHIAQYDALLPDFIQTPDEGLNYRDVVAVTPSTDDGFGSPISDSGKFVVIGNFSVSNVFVGDTINVINTINVGTYVITSIIYDSLLDRTTFGVADLVISNIIEGQLIINVPANVFIVPDNWTARFTQGVQFDVIGGLNNDSYTVLRSEYVAGVTRIRVVEDVVEGDGKPIVNINGGFVIRGNHTSTYVVGAEFNVVGSPHNDGVYVVDIGGSVFDVISGTTTVPVVDTIDGTAGGVTYLFISGLLVEPTFGYAEDPTMCNYVPETVLHVVFDEHLTFSPGQIELHDDLIVYNMENTDSAGYELPLKTIFSATDPVVLSQMTPPTSPVIDDLWFDTNLNLFNIFDGSVWRNIITAWWLNTVDNTLHYRTRNAFVDTNWLLDSTKIPGFDDVFPAVGEKELLFSEALIAAGTDTFTLGNNIPNSDPALISVTLNGVPAGITVNSANEFTITSPIVVTNDNIAVDVFDLTRDETNAHVVPYGQVPHLVYHEYVTTDAINNAYIVSGGNFYNRFSSIDAFSGITDGLSGGLLGDWSVKSISVVEVDSVLETISVVGDYTWLFVAGRVFNVSVSDNNDNAFTVAASMYDGFHTIIAVSSPLVAEGPEGPAQYFYNPGVIIYNIDEVTDTIIVFGNVADAYFVGQSVLISDSTTNNNTNWVVSNVVYDTINNRTNVSVIGDIPDPDSSTNARLHTPIFQNYSRDLGVIIGVVYDPDVNGIYPTNQIKTIVVPDTAIDANVTGITYEWVGPVCWVIKQITDEGVGVSMPDNMGIADELLQIPDVYSIVDTDVIDNYFVVVGFDGVASEFIDLTNRFISGSIITVAGSYSNDEPTNPMTNDAKYVVLQSFFDDPTLSTSITASNTTKVTFDNVYSQYDVYNGNVLLVLGVDYSISGPNELCFGDPIDCPGVGSALTIGDIITQIPVGIPIGWATGSGSTFVQIATDFDKLPPYNLFNVVGVSNNGTAPNTIRLSGNHKMFFDGLITSTFIIDQPLISLTPMLNILDVVDVEYNSTLMETILTVEGEFINEAYVGSLGIVESVYRADVVYDELNVTLPWVHGNIMRDVVRIDQLNNTRTAASIEDTLLFGWGETITWDIVAVDSTANLTVSNHDGNVGTPDLRLYSGQISIATDITPLLELDDRVVIRGSQGNDQNYEISSLFYDVGNDVTNIVLRTIPKDIQITVTADIGGSLDGTYLLLSSSSTNYYVWYDVDNNGNDPLIVGRTGIRVHVNTNDTATDVATNTVAGFDSVGEFQVTATGDVVDVLILTSLGVITYATDITTNFVVDNYVVVDPDISFGVLELSNIDITDWFQYLVKKYDPLTSSILVSGDTNNMIQSGQQFRVLGTEYNNQIYTVASPVVYDAVNNVTTIIVNEPLVYGTNTITEIISSTSIEVLGNSARMVSSGDNINIVGSSGNDGTYSVSGISRQGLYSVFDISPSLPVVTVDGEIEYIERGGWVESLRSQGMRLIYRDSVGVGITEHSDAAVLSEGGSLIGAWDYPYWDVGSYDESIGTVIHLYSNTFSS